MKAFLRDLALFLAAAAAAHAGAIVAAPRVIMSKAIERLTPPSGINHWLHGPRVTEASRAVVRPSPDLAYSACAFDLSRGPVRITAAPWQSYMSVSAFADNTDNFFVVNDRTAPGGVDIVLAREGQRVAAGPYRIVRSPSTRGVVLERRLAPTAEAFAQADKVRRGDRCELLAATAS